MHCDPQIKVLLKKFLVSCRVSPAQYKFTENSEITPYALCFAIFLHNLIKDYEELHCNRELYISELLKNIYEERARHDDTPNCKSYRQLLCFTLSCLSILDSLKHDQLADIVIESIRVNVHKELTRQGCVAGAPQSGNHAMFLAIFFLHARDVLGINVEDDIQQWVELHLNNMNRYGFWGTNKGGMAHLQFQNGYHQYEIFEYLGVKNPRSDEAVAAVRSLADPMGHFAPYPGGGGCYDYDAVFVLTPNGTVPDNATRVLLERTAATLLAEQRPDGGFAESLYVRPRSLANLSSFAAHIARAAGNGPLIMERLRYGLALQRPKHDHIQTHWSRYSRRWDESDLWDSWFRMLTLARIEVALEPSRASDWGFINYPGIGFHPSARSAQ